MLTRSIFTAILACALSAVLSAQVVNIESRRMRTDSVRLAGFAKASLAYTENDNLSLLEVNADAGAQWKSRDLNTDVLLLASYTITRSRSVDYIDVLFGHLRFTRQLTPFLRWEAFLQCQKNPPLGITARLLSGTGPRLKFMDKKHFSAYFGTHYMFEHEVQSTTDIRLNQHRSSSYLSFSLRVPAIKMELISTTYYQPVWGDAPDFRVSTESQLCFSITEDLIWNTDLQWFYDSEPPEGIRNRSLKLIQGLKYQF